MSVTTKQGIIITGAVGILGGLSLYLWRQYTLLKSIGVKLAGVKFHKISLEDLSLTLDVKLTNLSDQRFVLEKYDLNVYIGNVFIANVKNNVNNVVLKAGGIPSILPVHITTNPKKAFGKGNAPTLVRFISNIGGGLLNIKGTVSVRHPLLYLQDFPVDFKYVDEEEKKK